MIALLAGWLLATASPAPADDRRASVDRRTPVVVAVERATPAVVTVEVEVERQNPWAFWDAQRTASEGSGVVIRAEGIVLTNAHVVAGAHTVHVRLADGRRLEANVTALESDLDLAVLQIPGVRNLLPVAIGDSDSLLLGETAIAIGNPLGLGLTVSTGVVSSIARDVEIQPGLNQTFVQTDAAINPGNSGGALINLHGELIGINNAIRADAEGIGFAIPVNRAMKIAADLVDFGAVRAPWLGIDVANTGLRTARGGAVRITGVLPGGPGAAAGLAAGDLITEIDGHALSSRADLNARLAERSPGDTLRLRVLREQRYAEVAVASRALPADAGQELAAGILGIQLAPTRGGVAVVRAARGGRWLREGLQVGDVILAIDGSPTRDPADAYALLRRARAQHRGYALFSLRRGTAFGRLRLPLH